MRSVYAGERCNTFLFYACLIALLIPLWAFKHFPSQDGPLHLYNATALRSYDEPASASLREFFSPNPRLVPNWICPHVLPVLVGVFSSDHAEKVLLSAYLILFPLSIRYALRAIRRRAGLLALAAFPFVPNQYYHMGFHDFCMSLPAFFFVTGYWFKHRRRFAARHAVVLSALLLLLYLTHVVSLIMVVMLIGVTALAINAQRAVPIRVRVTRLLAVAIPMVPVLGLTAYFMLEPHPNTLFDPMPHGWHRRFYFLADWMKAYQYRELLCGVAMFILFGLVTLWLLTRRRQATLRRGIAGGLAFTVLLYAVIFLIAPDALAGGQLLIVRLASYPLFALLLWWAALPIGSRAFTCLRRGLTAVSVPAVLYLLVVQSLSYADLNNYLVEFDAIPALIPAGSTVLPIHFNYFVPHSLAVAPKPPHALAIEIDPFRHVEARGLAERGIVDLANHWATTDHHSVVWKPGLDPMTPNVDSVDNFLGYEKRTGQKIDYVLFWSGGVAHDDLQGQLVNIQLRQEFELIYTSPRTGYLCLYRRRGEQP